VKNPVHELEHIAHKLRERIDSLILNLIAQDFIAVSLDTSAIATAVTDLQTIATEIGTGDQAAIAAAVAAAQESDQAALDAAVAPLTAEIAALKAQLNPPVALSVSPASITGTAGTAITGTLSVTGGTAPYTFTSSLADISVDASGNLVGTPAAAEAGTITVTDSASTHATASVSVTIS
jgi:hypothetical protein